MRRTHYHPLEEQQARWASIFEIVSASVILFLIALLIFLVLTYTPS